MTIDVQSALIGVCVTFAVALGMLLRRRRRRTDTLFVILSSNLGLWFLATILRGIYGPDPWLRVEFAISALVPASLLRLFVDLLRGSTANARRLMATSYPLSAILFLACLSPLGDLEIVRVVTGVYIGGMVLLTARGMRDPNANSRTVESARLGYLTIGAILTTLLSIAGRIPVLGIEAAAAGHLAVMVYLFFLAQAISRDRLLDLHEFVSRMTVLGVLGLLFAALSTLLFYGLGGSQSTPLFATIVSVIILLTIYDPLRDRLEAKTLELFFRERTSLRSLLEQLRHRMLRVLDPAKMSRQVLDTLYDTRRATHAAVYLLDPLGGSFLLSSYRGPEPAPRVNERELPALWHAIQRHRSPLLAEQLLRESDERNDKGTHRDLLETMRKVSADVLLPFVSGETVLGFLALRDDRTAEPYSTEEIALLLAVTEAAVIVLENSQLSQRLRERDRLAAIGEMAAGLAHEIRNPLGAIKGAAQCLDPARFAGDEHSEFLQVIIEESNRLNGVVSQFLDYARPYRASFSPANLNEVVKKTVKLVEARSDRRPVAIQVDLDPELPETEVDAEQLKQVILNLLLNAIEASPENGPPVVITSRFDLDSERMELRVRDRGAGIPREAIDHIFIPFFTTKTHGTGLGLAVCQRIVTSHGGSIQVQSEVGHGTEFLIRLPLTPKRDLASTTGNFSSPNHKRIRGLNGPAESEPDLPGPSDPR